MSSHFLLSWFLYRRYVTLATFFSKNVVFLDCKVHNNKFFVVFSQIFSFTSIHILQLSNKIDLIFWSWLSGIKYSCDVAISFENT